MSKARIRNSDPEIWKEPDLGDPHLNDGGVDEVRKASIRHFDPELWQKPDLGDIQTSWPHRASMVDSLIGSGALIGLTRDEVVELLGHWSIGGHSAFFGEFGIDYYVGPERGMFGIDSEFLSIAFSPEGAVDRVKLTTD